jgi:hypothetical protein
MRKRLPPEISERLEACRAIYKAARKWHSDQIRRLDRTWGDEGFDLLNAAPVIQRLRLERLDERLQALIKATPAEALTGEPERKDDGH